MLVARTREHLDDALRRLRDGHRRLALVPTMGALHAGHLALVADARRHGGVVASIFVNPLQFAPSEDLARYPRDEPGDLAALAQAGCDAVWLPDAAEMYASANATIVEVGGPALGWEGDARPGHFRGVATVVAKLFGQVRPDIACFGEKDWQQLQVIRRMTADLALPVEVRGVATEREPDGLALSSRNRFLTDSERRLAPFLHATLLDTRRGLHVAGEIEPVLAYARSRLQELGFALEYLALVSGETMQPASAMLAGTRLIAAARLGSVRLLDNIDAT